MEARPDEPMVVNFLLEDTPLFGGVKVVLRQADLLENAGFNARIVSPGDRPDWYPLQAEFVKVGDLSTESIPPADVQVATYWTTIAPALGAHGSALHYCQGFEGIYTHNVKEHEAIVTAYGSKLPAITVSPHLTELVQTRFRRPARTVLQPLEEIFGASRAKQAETSNVPRILLMSPFEIDWKGVATGLDALSILRHQGIPFELVRISQWPRTAEEVSKYPDAEFHCHLTTDRVAAVMQTCDLLIAPSWEQEGFGLPALEAMAAGLNVVASDISCYRASLGTAASLVPWNDPGAFAGAIAELLDDQELRQSQRDLGKQIAERYSESEVTGQMGHALEWVANGEWAAEWETLNSVAVQ